MEGYHDDSWAAAVIAFDTVKEISRTTDPVELVDHNPDKPGDIQVVYHVCSGHYHLRMPIGLVKTMSSDCLYQIIAHEIGHIKLSHVKWRVDFAAKRNRYRWMLRFSLGLGALLSLSASIYESPFSSIFLAIFGILAVIISISEFIDPVVMWESRVYRLQEYEADAYSCQLLNDIRGMKDMITWIIEYDDPKPKNGFIGRMRQSIHSIHPTPERRWRRAHM